MPMKILLVEDDQKISSFVKIGLESNDCFVDIAYDSSIGEKLALSSVLTPQIAGHNLKNKLGLIKFGSYDNNKKKIYT